MAAYGRPQIMEEHGTRFLMINQQVQLVMLLYRRLIPMLCMLAVARVCSVQIFLLVMECISQQMQEKHGRILDLIMFSKSVDLLSIPIMRIAFLLQLSGILMVQTQSVVFTEQLTAEKHGKKFYTKMKIQALYKLLSILKIPISFTYTCGLQGKAHGRMANGTALKVVCINQLMEELHGRN